MQVVHTTRVVKVDISLQDGLWRAAKPSETESENANLDLNIALVSFLT